MDFREKIAVIAKENAIDESDSFGKYLVLNELLKHMGEKSANDFMDETLMMLEDEINDLFNAYGFDEEIA